jgi:hypothetical protein
MLERIKTPTTSAGNNYRLIYQLTRRFALRKPLDLHQATLLSPDHSPGQRFLISPGSLADAGYLPLHKLREPLSDNWGIERSGAHINRVWIEFQGLTYPTLITNSELARTKRTQGVELADLINLKLMAKDGAFVNSGVKIDTGRPSNDEIRAMIQDFMAGTTRAIPPVLFADIDERGEFLLANDRAGKPIKIKVCSTAAAPLSYVAVHLRSPSEANIIIRRHDGARRDHDREKSIIIAASSTAAAANRAAKQKPMADHIGSPTPTEESRAIQAWIFKASPLLYGRIRRSIHKNCFIHLTSKKATPIA